MSGAPDYIGRAPVNADDRFAAVSVPSGGAETQIIQVQTRVGLRAFVVFLGTSTDGAAADIVWNLKSAGAKMFPYADFSIQVGEISRPSDFLPWPIEVPQNTTVEITAVNNGGASSVCSGRLVVFYTEH